MPIDPRLRSKTSKTLIAVTVTGTLAAAALAATHPALAAGILDMVTCATTTACSSATNSGSGPAFAATGTAGPGLSAASTSSFGVIASSNAAAGIKGSSNTNYGIEAISNKNYGLWGSSLSGKAGIAGTTPSGFGVFGYTATGGFGVVGQSQDGTGTGVAGTASGSGYGLFGSTTTGVGAGVIATGSGIGLAASSTTGPGVESLSAGGVSYYGRNTNGNGADIEGTSIGIIGRAPAPVGNTIGYPLVLTDQNSNVLFYVDSAGNVSYSGALSNLSRIANGATVKSYSTKTTQPTVEDYGTAQLVDGAAVVRLDPAFAASIDTRDTYRVFVTPNGDTHELYIPTKTTTGFIVREAQSGRSTTSFDYRIVATSLGHAGQRMAVVGAAAMPAVANASALLRHLQIPAGLLRK